MSVAPYVKPGSSQNILVGDEVCSHQEGGHQHHPLPPGLTTHHQLFYNLTSPRPARQMTWLSFLPGAGLDLIILLSGARAARESQLAQAHAPLRLPCSALRLSGNHCPELWVHGAAIFPCCWRWGGHQLSLITRQTTGQPCPRLLIEKSGLPLFSS